MCERYGIINCRNLDDMVETVLAFQAGGFPKGNRIGFVTTSGGTVDLLWDYAERRRQCFRLSPSARSLTLKPMMQDGIRLATRWMPDSQPDGKRAQDVRGGAARPNVDMVAWASQLPGRKASGTT